MIPIDKNGNYACPECEGSLVVLEQVEWGAVVQCNDCKIKYRLQINMYNPQHNPPGVMMWQIKEKDNAST